MSLPPTVRSTMSGATPRAASPPQGTGNGESVLKPLHFSASSPATAARRTVRSAADQVDPSAPSSEAGSSSAGPSVAFAGGRGAGVLVLPRALTGQRQRPHAGEEHR